MSFKGCMDLADVFQRTHEGLLDKNDIIKQAMASYFKPSGVRGAFLENPAQSPYNTDTRFNFLCFLCQKLHKHMVLIRMKSKRHPCLLVLAVTVPMFDMIIPLLFDAASILNNEVRWFPFL